MPCLKKNVQDKFSDCEVGTIGHRLTLGWTIVPDQNQGTEATLNCVVAFLTLHEFIGIKSASNGEVEQY